MQEKTGGFLGAVFDVDGVLVDSPHERAWREAFQELMETEWSDVRGRSTYTPERFTPSVYQEVMSGKPRMSGARAALDYFEVPDPESRLQAYADLKQSKVVELIKAGEFTAFPDAMRFILAVKDSGIPVAAASSSKNAGLFLERIQLDEFTAKHDLHYDFVGPGLTLQELFDADISGRDFEQGKPHPKIFLTAAEELGVNPQGCFVVEDATSGVEAARAGNMAALGVARMDDEAFLEAAGADLVVSSLDEVSLEALYGGRLEPVSAHR
ncbi:MAG: HAD-IA family hydrolase [Rubrobacter sp.]|nr:HAD-IA family hydrolase [Rubrobacter sp.]